MQQKSHGGVSWYFVTFNFVINYIALNVVIALIIETFTIQRSFFNAEESILLDIPDENTENSSGKKIKWKIYQTLGPRWERFVIEPSILGEWSKKDQRDIEIEANLLIEKGTASKKKVN